MSESPDNSLRVAVLGRVRAWVDDDEVVLGPARQRAVFAALAMKGNRAVGRDELVGAVWGESAPPSATGSVHTYISGLRRALALGVLPKDDTDLLVSDSSGYTVRIADEALDANRFISLRAEAQRRLTNGDRAGAVSALKEALALWHGEAFAGLSGPFVELERHRLDEMRMAAIEQRIRLVIDLGGHDEVLPELMVLVREHELKETLRELLILALHRAGRQAQALEAYRDTRQILVRELGIEPRPSLQELHRQILAGSAQGSRGGAAAAEKTSPGTSSVTPLVDRPSLWVGRQRELAVVQSAVDALGRGAGSVIWVEGEPGIGKSALVAAGVDRARDAGCQTYWGTADELSRRLPLRVVLDCLQVRQASPDRRRASIADYLRDQRPGLLAVNDVVYTAAEMLLALVDVVCAEAPTVIVVDDIQWADEASLTVWHRLALAVRQVPLLLVATCHPAPRRPAVQKLRATVRRHSGTVVRLGPLTEAEIDALVTSLQGSTADESMRELAASAMGNPLYVRELISASGRERSSATRPATADASANVLKGIPPAFTAALRDRLSFMSSGTLEMLRTATLLGREFAVTDLAALLHRPAFELTTEVQEALDAEILTDVDSRLAFRHPLIRQALYEGMSPALRAALHRDAARTLADSNAEPLVVAQQLLVAGQPGDSWARHWLIDAAPALAARAPELAVELLRKELKQAQVHREDRAALTVALTRIIFDLGRHDEAVRWSREALAVAADPASRGEIQWLMARSLFSLGDNDDAVDIVGQALRQADVPITWRARLLGSLAMFQRAGVGGLDAAEATARDALRAGEEAGDTFATSYALVGLWSFHSVRRDHVSALECIDRARAAVGDAVDHADLRSYILDGRVFTMQNLDRWPEAEATLLEARELAHRNDSGIAAPGITAAVLMYWLGRWDDAMAELTPVNRDLAEITYSGLRERGPALLWHGVDAVIAAHRDERHSASDAVRAGLALPVMTVADRENSDFLIAAHAVLAEQSGDLPRAVSILSPLLDRQPAEMTLAHQWLPDLVRLALAAGDDTAAMAAVRACQAEAAAEVRPARAAAANNRCLGLYHRDPAALREAVSHYRTVGPPVQLPGALEDLAVVLAEQGHAQEAGKVLNEAVARYAAFGAVWDIGRAECRLDALGVRPSVHEPRPRAAAFGWDALTFTESRIAAQVARGQSTTQIAEDMLLSRTVVQTHVERILTKLGARSRVEVARLAELHGAATVPADGS